MTNAKSPAVLSQERMTLRRLAAESANCLAQPFEPWRGLEALQPGAQRRKPRRLSDIPITVHPAHTFTTSRRRAA